MGRGEGEAEGRRKGVQGCVLYAGGALQSCSSERLVGRVGGGAESLEKEAELL